MNCYTDLFKENKTKPYLTTVTLVGEIQGLGNGPSFFIIFYKNGRSVRSGWTLLVLCKSAKLSTVIDNH